MTRRFDMPSGWAGYNSGGARTDSRTLPPAAFPSLPLDRQAPEFTAEGPTEDFEEDDVFSDEEDDPASPVLIGEELLFPENDRPDVLNHVHRMAFEFEFENKLPEDPELEDRVLEAHNQMLKNGVFQKSKSQSKGKGRASLGDEANVAKLVQLERRKEGLQDELRQVGRNILGPQAPPGIPSAEQPPSSPSLDEPMDYELKKDGLKNDIRFLKSEIWSRKHHARHAAKAKKDFFNLQPEPLQPQRASPFIRGRPHAGRLMLPPAQAPPEPMVPQLGVSLSLLYQTSENTSMFTVPESAFGMSAWPGTGQVRIRVPSVEEFEKMQEGASLARHDSVIEVWNHGTAPAVLEVGAEYGRSEYAELAGVDEQTPLHWLDDNAAVSPTCDYATLAGFEEEMPLHWLDGWDLPVPMSG